MNPVQVEYFRQKFLHWKGELLSEASETLNNLSEENLQKPDVTDRAQVESDTSIRLRTRDRERKLLSKIDPHFAALMMAVMDIAKKQMNRLA